MAEIGFDNFMTGFILPWEIGHDMTGAYHEDANDPGGATKWGICKRDFPDIDIKNLDMASALRIYFQEYWLKTGRQKSYCDSIPHPLNFSHLDCCVNVGNWKRLKDGTPYFTGRANMMLQRAVEVDDDGLIGKITLAAIEKLDPLRITSMIIDQRDNYYQSLGTWANEYKEGWLNRTTALRKYLGLPA